MEFGIRKNAIAEVGDHRGEFDGSVTLADELGSGILRLGRNLGQCHHLILSQIGQYADELQSIRLRHTQEFEIAIKLSEAVFVQIVLVGLCLPDGDNRVRVEHLHAPGGDCEIRLSTLEILQPLAVCLPYLRPDSSNGTRFLKVFAEAFEKRWVGLRLSPVVMVQDRCHSRFGNLVWWEW